MNLQTAALKANDSKIWNFILNFSLLRKVPFNKPHRFWVNYISPQKVVVRLPYKRSNMNHLKGIHACAMATTSEYASGLLLLLRLNPKKYRLIMESLEAKYHYQGKINSITEFEINDEEFERRVLNPLQKADLVYLTCIVKTFDNKRNLLSTVTVNWQIKKWDKVKTAV